jgi:hypothetical protein
MLGDLQGVDDGETLCERRRDTVSLWPGKSSKVLRKQYAAGELDVRELPPPQG